MLGTRQYTRYLPYPAATQLCTHPISFWCCCRMAETTQQTSAMGNKTNLSQTSLTHPRQRHPATLYRDMMTDGAPATTSASSLMKKCITKRQWFFYYLNAGNYRFLPWWFRMKQRHPPTETQRPQVHRKVVLHLQQSSWTPTAPPNTHFLLFLYDLVTVFYPLRLCSAHHTPFSSPPAFAVPAACTSSSSLLSEETNADARRETAERSLQVN